MILDQDTNAVCKSEYSSYNYGDTEFFKNNFKNIFKMYFLKSKSPNDQS